MKSYDVSRLPSMITLGYEGENNWRPKRFDCSALLKNHPNGVISLWLLPHGESQAFPVAVQRDGNTIIWTPLSEEMTAETGALQIVCTDGTDVGKSAVVMFRVDESILPGADHPAAVPSWATQTIERAESAADRAEEAAESIDVDHLEQIIAAAVEAYLIEHPVDAPVTSVNGKSGAVRLNAEDVGALPADTPIPPAITVDSALSSTSENPVQNKVINAALQSKGTYSKPSGGIPASDLADGVISKDVFVAVRGTTTQTEIEAAHSAGKIVICIYQNRIYYLSENDTITLRTAPDVQGKVYALFVTGSRWTGITYNLALASDIPTAVSELTNDSGFQTAQQVQTAISGKADKTPRVAMASTDTTLTLDPNKLYVFPEMASLTPTLNTPSDATILNEYHFCFDSGSTATVLTVPAPILQPDGFTVEANMHYEISILEGAMTAQGWAVTP